jgi:hypothetical protein
MNDEAVEMDGTISPSQGQCIWDCVAIRQSERVVGVKERATSRIVGYTIAVRPFLTESPTDLRKSR